MNLYDIVLAVPLIGFLLCIFVPTQQARKLALIVSVVTFVLSLGLIPGVLANPGQMLYSTDVQWISYPPIRYHVAIDGVSLWLIVLSTLLTP